MTATSAIPDTAIVERFDRVTRLVHWATAVLVAILLVTAAALYIDGFSVLVGRRALVREVHVVAGLALPLPLVAGIVGRRGGRLRVDIRTWNRWSASDVRWLRSMGRDPSVAHGRFHPAQKLNAAFTGGWIVLMLVSGSIMRWFAPFPLTIRTGATFVHDWLSVAIVIVLLLHVRFALRDRTARRGMREGWVTLGWARRHHPAWAAEQEQAITSLANEVQPGSSQPRGTLPRR